MNGRPRTEHLLSSRYRVVRSKEMPRVLLMYVLNCWGESRVVGLPRMRDSEVCDIHVLTSSFTQVINQLPHPTPPPQRTMPPTKAASWWSRVGPSRPLKDCWEAHTRYQVYYFGGGGVRS